MWRSPDAALLADDAVRMIGGPGAFESQPLQSPGAIRRIEDLPSIQTWAAQRVEHAVDGLIVRNGVNLITGKPGAGKSMLSTAMAAACARGEKFLGRGTERLKVLLLDRENPAGVVAERFELFGVPDHGVYAWGGWVPEQEPPPPDAPIVLEFCRRNPALVIVDTLIRFHGGEESSATDTAAFMGRCRKVAATGAGVVLLHHTGKGPTATDYRGSSDIAGAVDTAYALELNDGGRGLESLKLRCFKYRVGEAPEPLHLRLADGKFEVTSDPSADLQRAKFAAVIEAVRSNPGITTLKLIDAVRKSGAGRNEAQRLIQSAVDGGDILKSEDGRGAHCYRLAGELELAV